LPKGAERRGVGGEGGTAPGRELRLVLRGLNQSFLQRELMRPEVSRQIGLVQAPGDDADRGIRELTHLLRGKTGGDHKALAVVKDNGSEQQSHALPLKRPRQPARY